MKKTNRMSSGAAAVALVLCGCGISATRSYSIGHEGKARVGEALAVVDWHLSLLTVQYRLEYRGLDRGTVRLQTREIESGVERITRRQDLSYDLDGSRHITAGPWDLEILDATNESIRFRILREPRPQMPD